MTLNGINALHLVTPSSEGKPICGETAPDAEIGVYGEHLDDKGDWCREVFGKLGTKGRACAACLTLYPSLLWGRRYQPNDGIDLQAVLRISPYPQSIRDEFFVTGSCISDDFVMAPEPTITSQRVIHGKVALTVMAHITPKPIGRR